MARTTVSSPLVDFELLKANRKNGWRQILAFVLDEASKDEEGELDRERLAQLRELLLAACGGCENTLTYLLHLASSTGWCGELAKYRMMGRGEAWKRGMRDLRRIRQNLVLARTAASEIDRYSLGFILAPREAVSMKRIDCWMVTLPGFEASFPSKPIETQLASYIAANYEILFRRRNNLFEGGMDLQGGGWQLSIARLFSPDAFPAALRLARQHGRYPVMNLHTMESFWPPKYRRRAG